MGGSFLCNKLKNAKKYIFTTMRVCYLIGITIFCHKYSHRLLKSPIALLFFFSITIFFSICSSNYHQQINKICKALVLSLCTYGITALLLIKLIMIKYPKNYKKILSLTPVASVNFMINYLIVAAILSVAIIFTSKDFNEYGRL